MYKFGFKELARDEFVYRLFVNLMTGVRESGGMQAWDELQALTDNWSNVELTIQINGVAVDAEHMLRLIEHVLAGEAQKQARALINNLYPDFYELQSSIDALTAGVQEKVKDYCKTNNIYYPEDI